MRAREVVRLGGRMLWAEKKRSALVMGVVAVLFALALVLNMGVAGLRRNYLAQAGWATEGQVVVAATAVGTGEVELVAGDEQGDLAVPTVGVSEATARQAEEMAVKMQADLEGWGAEVEPGLVVPEALAAEVQALQAAPLIAVPESWLAGAVEVNPQMAPVGSLPVLMTKARAQTILDMTWPDTTRTPEQKQQNLAEFRTAVVGQALTQSEMRYFVTGLAPVGFGIDNWSYKGVERLNQSVFNLLLEMLTVTWGEMLVLDDGGLEPAATLVTPAQVETGLPETWVAKLVARFPDALSAMRYAKQGQGDLGYLVAEDKQYQVQVLAGAEPATVMMLDFVRLGALGLGLAMAAVAAVVVVFTTIRLVDREQENLRLYYSLGATARQVRGIYLAYFGGLMLGAAVLALVAATVILLVYSAVQQSLLGALFQAAFSLPEAPTVWLWGVNWETGMFLGLMLLTAGLAVLVNWRKLGARQ